MGMKIIGEQSDNMAKIQDAGWKIHCSMHDFKGVFFTN